MCEEIKLPKEIDILNKELKREEEKEKKAKKKKDKDLKSLKMFKSKKHKKINKGWGRITREQYLLQFYNYFKLDKILLFLIINLV